MSHLQDAAIQAAETIQSAHINHRPSIEQDLAPETAADTKRAVRIDDSVDLDALSDIDEDEIPVSILKPPPRGPQMPPLPDLRFEQSYLASIKDAKDWQTVGWITLRDHVLMSLFQGVAWTLILAGWRHWNGAAYFSGKSVGAKIRRWWWGVNNWKIPEGNVLQDRELAEGAADFYKGKANAGSD